MSEQLSTYVTKRELAKFYGVSTRTIDVWRSEGKIPQPEMTPGGRPRWKLKKSALLATALINSAAIPAVVEQSPHADR